MSSKRRTEYQTSKNFVNGRFKYPVETTVDYNVKALLPILRQYIKGNPRARPKEILPVQRIVAPLSKEDVNKTAVTWLGHSTSLIQLEGRLLLLDPIFESYSSPFRFGGRRYSEQLPIEIEDLPQIDAVLISHDHYDHLDFRSIMKLKDKVRTFLVPLGVGGRLERWGVVPDKIVELDWWEEFGFEGLKFRCTPAKHSSGRGIFRKNTTLWCSWIIEGKHTKIFFSGDSGYGPHFKEIGEICGPFDLTLIDAGQYDNNGLWPLHMLPEETVQAHIELHGNILLPVHWGAFTLAFHDWDEPIKRVLKAAAERSVVIAVPRIGESVEIGSSEMPSVPWWRDIT
ncbi:MBL fold metallo-hydrolase [Paenibacillus vulneris]|uniref:MBL fold metallo-hydrolase n=1 Tax=Paenibacillus vulneris TaxID=1133364 RepID=A0ABW3UMF1_9BACL